MQPPVAAHGVLFATLAAMQMSRPASHWPTLHVVVRFEQLGGDHHAALFVEVGLGRPGEEEAVDPAPFLAERIHRGESRLDESIPIRTTVGVQAAVEASRDDDTVLEGFSELGRKSETVFVIDRVVVCA